MIAAVTSTPLNVIWTMTLGQVTRYMRVMPTVLPVVNPVAALGKSDEPISDPAQIKATLAGLNVKGV